MLVNLQLTTENGSLNIGFGEVAAQKTQEEQLDEVEVTGSAYTECSYCHSQVEKKICQITNHIYAQKERWSVLSAISHIKQVGHVIVMILWQVNIAHYVINH